MNNLSGSRKIYAIGSLILGILLLFWPGSALRMVSYVAGILVMSGGVASILSNVRARRNGAASPFGLAAGILVTFVGAWIFLKPENLAQVIPTAIGYLMVVSGIVNLLETFSLSRAHYRNWWLSLLAGLATIFMGLFMVNHAFGIAVTMVRFAGGFLVFNGATDLWICGRVDKYVRYEGRRGVGSGGGPDIIDAEDYREL